jgi:hypothetical protein
MRRVAKEIAKVVSGLQKRVQDMRPGWPKFIVYISNPQPIAARQFTKLSTTGNAAPSPTPTTSQPSLIQTEPITT